jgi:hypothetical protein
MRASGPFSIIFRHFFVVPKTLGRSQVIFWNFFYPHVGPHFGHVGSIWGKGPFEISSKHVFVVPKTSGASQVIFWNFFYPHVGSQFDPGGSRRGGGLFEISSKHVFVVPKTSGASQVVFGFFLSPHFECGDKFTPSRFHKSDLAYCTSESRVAKVDFSACLRFLRIS